VRRNRLLRQLQPQTEYHSRMYYFAWIDNSYWRGQELLSSAQIARMVKILNYQYQMFTSVQKYNQNGNILSCPIYLDFDGDFDTALQDIRYVVGFIQVVMKVNPHVYFSGGKGFHLTIPVEIKSPDCHWLVKWFAKQLSESAKTIDLKVYRPRAMWRLPNSPASRPGRYKIQLSNKELNTLSIDEIIKLSHRPREFMNYCDVSKIPSAFLNDIYEEGKSMIPQLHDNISDYCNDFNEDFTACLQAILNHAKPGNRNLAIFTLTRFFKRCDLPQSTTLSILLSKPHFAEYESECRGVSKVVRSVYNMLSTPNVGCKGNSDTAEYLRNFCDPLCFYNDNCPTLKESFSNDLSTTKR